FVAHFGGILAGMTIGYVFFSAYSQKLLKDPRFWMCIVGYFACLIFAVFFNIFLSLAVFIYYAVWKPQKQWVTLDEGIWRSPLTYDPHKREEAWRFVSYMFVHAVEHIVGNLLMQLVLGIPLELVHKGHEVGAVYLAGVLASLASSIFDPVSALVGASGGVYALIGGYFMNAVVMGDSDPEQGRSLRGNQNRPNRRNENEGCFEKFQNAVSKWMLPETLRSDYLERANCRPPPIFIILISIAE
uniref:rhomboid protease n=1 Tax=Fundulus heteroclitus TaxID=8078 RepID=A0A3Q2TJM6_FUNHE